MCIRFWAVLGAFTCAAAATFPPSEVKVIGSIDYGETSSVVHYSSPPKYRAFKFNGKPGDHISIWVHSRRGVPQGFLTDSNFKSITGGKARFSTVIPAQSQPATYYILFNEARFESGEFTVELERPSVSAGQQMPPGYLVCQSDSDCIAVDRAGCCRNGYKDAINKDRVEAYKAANACPDPHAMCPQYMVLDNRVALCNTAQGKCEMVKPDAIPCGGFIRNAHSCPEGYTCQVSKVPDAGGMCVKN